ncbi:MAG: undecaprenyl/decaprenyl-phosphate alpha-N-acetylglucosaminyl 1-phosphate transferase [Pseudomonadales bacterium]|nr:undecaprenyl/decaprenyl-phosphate alpha-N-acetylglucosaminyl 1-phosphate transferase [Pseudomonadales bacterium]
MILGSLIPLLIWLPFQREYVAIALAIAVIFFFGLWDDRKDLSYKFKFFGQLLAASLVVFVGGIYIKFAPFMSGSEIPVFIAYPFTILCLVAITNAMNLADGLDGLAGGTTLLSFGVVGVLCLISGAPYILIVTMSVVGGVLGFLRFNSHPAAIFMGDTGSQFLGLILGVELLLLTQQADIMLAKTLPLLILGLPLVDTVTVMAKRLLSGKSPFAPDKNHLHHRLLKLGFSHYETVVILYLAQSVFVLSGFFSAYAFDYVPAILFMVYSLMIVFSLWYLERHQFSFQQRGAVRVYLRTLLKSGWQQLLLLNLDRLLYPFILLAMPLFTFNSLPSGVTIGSDIAFLTAIIGACFLFLSVSKVSNEWCDRVLAYTLCACVAFLGYQRNDLTAVEYALEWGLILIAGLLVFVAIFTSKNKVFETSPFDILLVLLAFLLPYFSKDATDVAHLPLDIVKFIVLLYVFEYLINNKVFSGARLIRIMLCCCAFGISINIFL